MAKGILQECHGNSTEQTIIQTKFILLLIVVYRKSNIGSIAKSVFICKFSFFERAAETKCMESINVSEKIFINIHASRKRISFH